MKLETLVTLRCVVRLVIAGSQRQFVPQTDSETGEWRKLNDEELSDLYCSANIIRVIKSRRMRWVRYVARMGERRGV